MYTREEASRTRQEFWTAFGRYMSPVTSSEGLKTNWINYHTSVKDIYFRMDAGQKSAAISISIEHADPIIRQQHFRKFLELKNILHGTLAEIWEWEAAVDKKNICRIYKELPDTSVLNKDQWADLISFFKPRIIALDVFWENAKYAFGG